MEGQVCLGSEQPASGCRVLARLGQPHPAPDSTCCSALGNWRVVALMRPHPSTVAVVLSGTGLLGLAAAAGWAGRHMGSAERSGPRSWQAVARHQAPMLTVGGSGGAHKVDHGHGAGAVQQQEGHVLQGAGGKGMGAQRMGGSVGARAQARAGGGTAPPAQLTLFRKLTVRGGVKPVAKPGFTTACTTLNASYVAEAGSVPVTLFR